MSARETIALTNSPIKNRCQHPRQPCSLYAEVRALTGRTDISRPSEICDISEEGCGMIVGRAYQPGSLLNIQIYDEWTGKRPVLRAGVVFTLKPEHQGGWILGIDFATQLTPADLAGLIRPAGAASK